MKKIIPIVFFLCALAAQAQDKKIEKQTVDASCGQCKFGMKSKKGCDLAVRIDNQTYFVEGAKMDQFGDAHGHDGMCNTVRKAEVSGEIKGDKFIASSFKVLPVTGHKHDAHDGHQH
ncbi:DUF6370 family protein [Flavobacterium sp.]|uniref:DUF6370 family protein n=1 Tax=Flavobacterium sp. TaxID=239 RepID=UPI0039E528A4